MEGIQYGGGISSMIIKDGRYLVQMCHAIITEELYHLCSRGHAVWTCHIINTEEGVQDIATKTCQEVAGGCIYLGE